MSQMLDDLIGIKGRIGPIRERLRAWRASTPSKPHPCALCGSSGLGKSVLAIALAEAEGFSAHVYRHDGLRRFLDQSRLPTLSGSPRLTIIDDAEDLTKREWKLVSDAKDIPILLTVRHQKQIPWPFRRDILRVDLPIPTPAQLTRMIEGDAERLGINLSSEEIREIAESSPSWRSAKIQIRTGGSLPMSIPRPTQFNQVSEILAGNFYGDIEIHPLSILSAAEFNNAEIDYVITGSILHSHGWEIEGLTTITKSYLSTLRTDSQDAVPYRQRSLISKVRKV